MHHIKSFGIVDRDYLEHGQIESFERAGVFVPDVAEVENLFLVPELIEAVAVQLLVDQTNAFKEVSRFVLEDFQRWLPTHAMEITHHKVALMLGRFSSGETDISRYATAFSTFRNAIDPVAVHSAARTEGQEAIAQNNYKLVLRLFNKKELSKNLGRFFGITKGSYVDKVKEMAKRGVGDVPQILRGYLPDLDSRL
jgi:hypothetical protein